MSETQKKIMYTNDSRSPILEFKSTWFKNSNELLASLSDIEKMWKAPQGNYYRSDTIYFLNEDWLCRISMVYNYDREEFRVSYACNNRNEIKEKSWLVLGKSELLWQFEQDQDRENIVPAFNYVKVDVMRKVLQDYIEEPTRLPPSVEWVDEDLAWNGGVE